MTIFEGRPVRSTYGPKEQDSTLEEQMSAFHELTTFAPGHGHGALMAAAGVRHGSERRADGACPIGIGPGCSGPAASQADKKRMRMHVTEARAT